MKLFPFRKYTASISLVISLVFVITAAFDYLNSLAYFALISPKLFEGLELWRLFTFQFIFPNIETALFSIIIFYYIGVKVEKLFNLKVFALVILMLGVFDGLLQSLIFYRSEYAIKSSLAQTFFLLSLYILLFRKTKIKFFFGSIKTHFIALTFGLVYLSFTTYKGLAHSHEYAVQTATSFVSGTSIAIFAYAQFRRKYYHELLNAAIQRYKNQNQFAHVYADDYNSMITKNNAQEKRYRAYSAHSEFEFVFDEEELNKVLDKISESGINSLTAKEKKFLEEYSKRINNDE